MKKFNKVITVFTAQELRGQHPEAYAKMIDKLRNNYDVWIEYEEIEKSFEAAAQFFEVDSGMKFSFGVYSRSWYDINIDQYMELSNAERNEIVTKTNDLLKNGTGYDFTGVYSDDYIINALYELAPDGVTYNDLHKHLPRAFNNAIKKAMEDVESTIEDDEYLLENLSANGFEYFTEDGKPIDVSDLTELKAV